MLPRPDGKTCRPGKRVPDLLLWAALWLRAGGGCRRRPGLCHLRHRGPDLEAGNAHALDGWSPVLVSRPVETLRGQQKLLDRLSPPPQSCLGSLLDEGLERVYHVVYGDGRAAVAARARPRARHARAMAHRGRSDRRHLSGTAALAARRAADPGCGSRVTSPAVMGS